MSLCYYVREPNVNDYLAFMKDLCGLREDFVLGALSFVFLSFCPFCSHVCDCLYILYIYYIFKKLNKLFANCRARTRNNRKDKRTKGQNTVFTNKKITPTLLPFHRFFILLRTEKKASAVLYMTDEQIAKIRKKEEETPEALKRDPLSNYREGWFHVTLNTRGEAPVLGYIVGDHSFLSSAAGLTRPSLNSRKRRC